MRNSTTRALAVDDVFATPDLRRLATSLAHEIGNAARAGRPPALAVATERPGNRALCYATGRASASR